MKLIRVVARQSFSYACERGHNRKQTLMRWSKLRSDRVSSGLILVASLHLLEPRSAEFRPVIDMYSADGVRGTAVEL